MGVDLRIFLVGHIALVPFLLLGTNAGDLTILLPEARSHDHYPVVVYECKNVQSGTCSFSGDIPPTVLPQDPQKRFGAKSLHGEDVSLLASAGHLEFSKGRRHHFYHNVTGEVPDNGGARDFSWVASMARVTEGNGKIKRSVLESQDPAVIAGRLRLQDLEGGVGSFGFVDLQSKIYSFTFEGTSSLPTLWGTKQAIADAVLVTLHLESDGTTLHFQDFGGGVPIDIHLARREDDVSHTIDIVVANLPPLLMPGKCDQDASGSHFGLYYDLLEVFKAGRRIPARGSMRTPKRRIEGPSSALPLILQFIEGPQPCFDWLVDGGPSVDGLSNRPICAEAVFASP